MKEKKIRKLLLVDDVEDNLDILNQFFTLRGYQTIVARGGAEAIEKAEKERPDLILLDIMMSVVDGFRVCEVLKKERTHFKNIPIILVTARDDQESKIKGFSLGADDYVTKPYDIKELEARVKTALRLKDARDELRELNELKNQFLGMASHDIKGPIGRIEQTIETILKHKENFTPKQMEQLGLVKKEAKGIFNLISDLLNVTKIETGKVGLDKKLVDISALIKEVSKMNEISAEAKGIHIETVIDPKVPKVVVDPDRILEVMDNLLTNAMKFSEKGQSISINFRSVENGVEFSVSDEGVGIPEDELPRLFQRFAKISTQPKSGEKGTGLGLSICKQIVELHNGKITAESKDGKGVRFTVFLPS